jgi:DNA-3-methyladenine glycosylase
MEIHMADKHFFLQDAQAVARQLLGMTLVRKIGSETRKAKIVETEAYYGADDPASRARQNGDLRETMLMGPGTILVYGVHNNWLINFVNNKEGIAQAVLLRALEPLNFEANCKGPGLLTKGMEVNKSFHKQNILNNKDLWLEPAKQDFEIEKSFRIGVSGDLPKKLRFYIKDNKHVSK